MKKGQLLVLIILLIIMSVVIWVGACRKDKGTEEEPSKTSATPVPTEIVLETPTIPPVPTETPIPDADPTPAKVVFPTIRESDFEGLSTKAVEWEAGFHKNDNDETSAWYNTSLDKYIKGFDYVFTKNDSNNVKELYLTFNISYDSQKYLEQILDILKEHNESSDKKAYVTFFVQEDCIAWKDLIKRIYNEGHQIALRAFPGSLCGTSPREIEKKLLAIEEKYREVIGNESIRMTYYRPGDEFSTREIAVANALGYKVVFYCFKYRDWDTQSYNADGSGGKTNALYAVADNFHDGSVIQLSCSELNAQILKAALAEGISEGFTFERLDQ